VTQPGDADALPDAQSGDADADRVDPADDFVSRNDGNTRIGQLTIDDVMVYPADTAGADLNADFVGAGRATRQPLAALSDIAFHWG
jgi:hypothetical protein